MRSSARVVVPSQVPYLMRSRVIFGHCATARVLSLVLLLSVCCLSGSLPAQSTVKIIPPAAEAELVSLLEQGRKLEGQRRWGDALALYEEALHNRPGERSLEQRVDTARIHYDLGRRYLDTSFRKATVTLTESQALDLYTQVLLKINTHYVNAPNWRDLFEHGTLTLETALGEAAFVENNLKNIPAERIETYRQDLRRGLATRPIRDRQDVREAADYAARLGLQELGMPAAATILEFTCGATGALDEYSTFLTGDQLNDLYSQIEGNFVGLGIELKAHDHSLLIVNVITGSPAEKAGIKPGDHIQSVNNRSTIDLTTDQAAELLQGEENSIVELVAVTGSESPRNLSVRRQHIDVPSVDRVKIADADNGVGYLKLSCFQKTTSKDLDTALWNLHNKGMRSLIIDLRGNPGGLLTAGVEVADKFIEQGTIVSTRGRNPQEDYTYGAHKAGTWGVPLVLLIDGDSASAAEIFAGAIRDQHRGTIVGVRSYGKGSVQGIFPLNVAGSGVRLTTAKFYSPNGKAYAHVGVEADVQVRQTAKPIDNRLMLAQQVDDDPVLTAGLQAAKQTTARQTTAAAR